jgi:hypothetical protein
VQVLAALNVKLVFGSGERKATKDSETADDLLCACLITVIAMKPIKKDTELLCDYGDSFWNAQD